MGYHQIGIVEKDIPKSAFITPIGHYEYTCMSFGLKSDGACFQRLMQHCFCEEVFQILLVFLDDIIVFSNDIEQHIARLKRVFEILKKLKLILVANV